MFNLLQIADERWLQSHEVDTEIFDPVFGEFEKGLGYFGFPVKINRYL